MDDDLKSKKITAFLLSLGTILVIMFISFFAVVYYQLVFALLILTFVSYAIFLGWWVIVLIEEKSRVSVWEYVAFAAGTIIYSTSMLYCFMMLGFSTLPSEITDFNTLNRINMAVAAYEDALSYITTVGTGTSVLTGVMSRMFITLIYMNVYMASTPLILIPFSKQLIRRYSGSSTNAYGMMSYDDGEFSERKKKKKKRTDMLA